MLNYSFKKEGCAGISVDVSTGEEVLDKIKEAAEEAKRQVIKREVREDLYRKYGIKNDFMINMQVPGYRDDALISALVDEIVENLGLLD